MAEFVVDKFNFDDMEKTLYSINFNTPYEMMKYIEEEPDVYPWNATGQLVSHIETVGNSNWYGSETFDEAITLFEKGDSENFDNLFNIRNEISGLMPYIARRRVTEYAPYGIRPSVPRFLTQNPNCMYKLTRKDLFNVVNIYYNVSAVYAVNSDAIQRRGMLTLSLVDLLEKLDYRVNLVFFDLNKNDNEYILIRLNIKDGIQSLDPSICFFPMCHPSFNRRITPAVMEKCSVTNEDWRKNYGNPCQDINEISKIFSITDKDIYITDDLGDTFGSNTLVEDIEIFLNNIHFNRFLDVDKEMVYDPKAEKFVIQDIPYEENNTFEIDNNDSKRNGGFFQKIKKRF